MPKMHIEKSMVIEAPVDKVYPILSDFNNWQAWSPWLITEPEAKVTVNEDGKYYEWEGKRTGSGNMRILDETQNRFINLDLNFLKPWKSHAKVKFRLEPEGDGTKVTWFMDSGLPFFLFWMKKMMTAFVGMDYERGLNMLKDLAETGEVPSKLDFKGDSDFAGCNYVGIERECAINELGNSMMEDFGKIKEEVEKNKDNMGEMAFSIYHKWDPVNNKVHYTGGWQVKDVPGNLPDGMKGGEIAPTKIHTVSHVGAYKHLGNAWSALYAMHRAKEFKPKKNQHPFEVYVSDPQQVAEKDLITDIHFPVN